MLRANFLEYRDYRYLKLAALLAAGALLGYWAATPAGGAAYGGTWFGYLLGIVCALLVLVLGWYGVRKRRPARIVERRKSDRGHFPAADQTSGFGGRGSERRRKRAEDSWRLGGTLQGWLSAHVYGGTALVVLASLHAGFRFDWSVHGLTYALLLLVVASGFYGVFAYLHYPRRISENLGEDTLDGLLAKIADLDEQARVGALDLPGEVSALVSLARRGTPLDGGYFPLLLGSELACPTEDAVQKVQELSRQLVDADQPKLLRDLCSLLLQKRRLVMRARNAISLEARMRFWLYVHTPLSVALVAALAGHVLTILVYW